MQQWRRAVSTIPNLFELYTSLLRLNTFDMNGTVNRHLRIQSSLRAMSNDIYKYKPLLQTHCRDTNEQGEILRSPLEYKRLMGNDPRSRADHHRSLPKVTRDCAFQQ
jgi:hypothetical protein